MAKGMMAYQSNLSENAATGYRGRFKEARASYGRTSDVLGAVRTPSKVKVGAFRSLPHLFLRRAISSKLGHCNALLRAFEGCVPITTRPGYPVAKRGEVLRRKSSWI